MTLRGRFLSIHYSLNGTQVLVFSKLQNLRRNLLFYDHKNLFCSSEKKWSQLMKFRHHINLVMSGEE